MARRQILYPIREWELKEEIDVGFSAIGSEDRLVLPTEWTNVLLWAVKQRWMDRGGF